MISNLIWLTMSDLIQLAISYLISLIISDLIQITVFDWILLISPPIWFNSSLTHLFSFWVTWFESYPSQALGSPTFFQGLFKIIQH